MVDIHPYVAGRHLRGPRRALQAPPRRRSLRLQRPGIGLVATNWLQAFSYGYDRLRFIKPVFIGDTIYTIRTNLAKEPKYPDRGLTRAKYEVYKGEGELVLYVEHLQTVLYRDAATARANVPPPR